MPIGRYEHRSEPLLPLRLFLRRLAGHGAIALLLLVLSLAIGIVGYHFLEGLSWIDAALEAAMILGGMGPTATLHSTAGKLFAAAYALYAGVAFLVTVGILLAPVVHRLLHRLHADQAPSSLSPQKSPHP
ncbi:MAG: hypothetical protein RML15_06755 [Bacteroidota bacterium]|nr:hypothetical protein [Candidatus Kapabacteria bacterium]MCS7302819.1 hypothetical protein [Candidatus Kapabacteria bacterium]MCX7936949.1 hypothetical protein [Chlorobiota bacterium]MDW8075589.1 hypothetical protein [Bacteroidota bacterium]MDW8272092.1 hypothetical protein [Bacteroidota bacterium]